MKTILFLEDDPDQSESISKLLNRSFPKCELAICDTESDLREKITSIPEGQLHFAVLDAMAPWCFPAEDMPVPPMEVQAEGIRYAGRRCVAVLREKYGPNLPIWIFSILTSDGHGVVATGMTFVLEKQPENGELVEEIRSKLNEEILD